jgi:peptidoglycan/LPS O-acetylase OafA/YrhL
MNPPGRHGIMAILRRNAAVPPMPPTRTAGLDTLRAAAIALVFMTHYMSFVSGTPTFGWASEIGWVGVDLFFVLSGYLIANQLFAGLAQGRALSLPRFYARRALRTLPVFWLVLAAFLLFPAAMGGRPPPPAWRFLTFTQNIGLTGGTAFSHAWSLCVEEQFYLVLPAVLVVGAALGRGRAAGWLLMAALLALGMTTRAVLWHDYGAAGQELEFTRHVYYATPCRFDEFLPGIAVALVKNFHRPLWARVMAAGQWWFAAGLAATTTLFVLVDKTYYVEGEGYAFFMTAFGYSLLAGAFAMLVVAALSPATWLHRLRVPGAGRLAAWSYSIYLSHKPLAHVLHEWLRPRGVPAGVEVVVITAACVAVGALLYRFVEAPFLALRDRWVPSNHRDAAARAAGAAGPAREAISP